MAAKAHIASDPLSGHVAAGLETQIQGVRNQLAAAQPLEVALRGTLGAVSTARQALSRAEQKATKLEAQVVAAVTAYEAAATEVHSCQKALADAEAATARTAGGRVDTKIRLGAHPGAALAVLSEAAAARCVVGAPGVDLNLAARVQAAFSEVQAVCRLLPADIPPLWQPGAPSAEAGTKGMPPTSASGEPSEQHMGEGASGGIAGSPHGGAPSGGSPADIGAVSSDQAVQAAHQHHHQLLVHQQRQLQQRQQLQPQHQIHHVPLPFDSAEDAIAWAQQQAAQQHHLQLQSNQLAAQAHQQAAAVQAARMDASQTMAATGPTPTAAAPALVTNAEVGNGLTPPADAIGHASSPTLQAGISDADAARAATVPVAPRDDAELVDGGPCNIGDGTPPRDDSMGGGAAEGVVNKRTAAEAVDTARSIAAKAKARAAS